MTDGSKTNGPVAYEDASQVHLLVDISAHGLGHLAQTAPVIRGLRRIDPNIRITVRSALPLSRLTGFIASEFVHVPQASDFGFVMRNAVDIDHAASAMRYRLFHRNWNGRVKGEALWLRANGVNAVLTNVAYLPLAAARAAGIPSASICSINWADLFSHYFSVESWAAEIFDQMVSAYLNANCFLRVSPGLPMQKFDHLRTIGPITRPGTRDRALLSRVLGLSEGDRWVLLAMGGMDFRIPIERWATTPGVTWLVPSAWHIARQDIRAYDGTKMPFADMLASVDAVITKPGYGTFVEAACDGVPVVYLARDDWPETPFLASWLHRHGVAQKVSREQLVAGEFVIELFKLWEEQLPPLPRPTGVADAVEVLKNEFGLGRR